MASLSRNSGARSLPRLILFSALLLIIISSFSFADILTPEKLEKSIAYCRALTAGSYPEWQGAEFTKNVTYYDMDGVPMAYEYVVRKDNIYLGFITLGARDEFYPFFEYGDTLPPSSKLAGALDAAREQGCTPEETQFVFLPPFDYMVSIKPEGVAAPDVSSDLLVHLDSAEVCPMSDVSARLKKFTTFSPEYLDKVKGFWRQYVLSSKDLPSVKQGADVYVAKLINTEARNYEYTWYKGCGPTSIAMMLSYYGGAWGYRNFWYDGPEAFDWCSYVGANGCYTIRDLHDKIVEMAQNIGDGLGHPEPDLGGPGYDGCILDFYGIYPDTAQMTIEAVAGFYSYIFTTDTLWHNGAGVSQGIITALQAQIDTNHPVYFSVASYTSSPPDTPGSWGTHAVLGVGYNYSGGLHSVIYHTTWGQGKRIAAMEHFSDWGIITAAPLGFSNTSPDLTEPSVAPLSGPPNTEFTFSIHYYDRDEANFYVDDTPDFEPFLAGDDNGGNWAEGSQQRDYKGDLIANNGLIDYEAWNDTGDHCSDDTWYSNPSSDPWPDPTDWYSSQYTPYNPKDGDSFIDLNSNLLWEAERFDDVNCNGIWDGDNGPYEAWVVVDEVQYPMLMVGDPATDKRSDCYYDAKIHLGSGVHEYYFYFKDGNGGTARLPARGDVYKNVRVGEQYNAAPILTDAGVTPTTGSRISLFTYSVHYEDTDGDAPGNPFVFIDDVPYQMWLTTGTADNGVYKYETFLAEADHEYYFLFDDIYGKATRWPSAGCIDGPIVLGGGQVPMLSDGLVSPRYPLFETLVTYTVRYTSPHDYMPINSTVVIDGSAFEMTFLEGVTNAGVPTTVPGLADFENGATYFFSTTDLSLGSHNYYFSFIDEAGGSGRLPTKGVISGPDVSGTNTPPVLSQGMVDPASGTTLTEFMFTARYSDINFNPARDVILYLDGTAYDMSFQSGTPENGIYGVPVTGLSDGLHSYYFYAWDSQGAGARLPQTEGEEFEGPFVRKTNIPPTLTNPLVTPTAGGFFERYVFSVHYFDGQGDSPHLMSVWLDGEEHPMTLTSGMDYDGTYGYAASPGTLSTGDHYYYFFANDGFGGTARVPESGYFIGPTVEYGDEAAIPYWLVEKTISPNYETSIVMTNVGVDPVTVEVSLTRYNGEPLMPHLVQVAGNETVLLKMSEVPGVNQSDAGTGNINWKNGKIVVWSKLDAGPMVAMDLTGARPGPLRLPFWQVIRSDIGTRADGIYYDTFLAFGNQYDRDVEAEITLYDEFGADLDVINVDIAPLGTRTVLFSETILDTEIGSAELVFSDPIRVWAVMLNKIRGGGIQIPVLDNPDMSPYFLPMWRNQPRMNLDTYVLFSNLGEKPATPQIRFYNDPGIIRGADLAAVPAGGMSIVQASRCTMSGESGWGRAIWADDADLGVFAVWLDASRSQFYSVPSSKSFEPPFYIPYWEFNAALNQETFIWVRNPNDVPVPGKIEVYDRHGYLAAQPFEFEIIPGGLYELQVSEANSVGYGSIKITTNLIDPLPLIAWGMLWNQSNANGCLIKAQKSLGQTVIN
ncbi:MAG: hypothetical protein JW941_03850 [Candidatus Coatesbacteria bacterium]|nr:hypothetical protein [Candidatus Coatesbacteria bacterium]